MPKQLLSICVSFGLLSIVATPGRAQSCRTNSDTASYVVGKVANLAAATDSIGKAVRDSLQISAVTSASSVVLITKAATCSSANAAYQSALSGGMTSTFSGKVYVVQSGKSYVVWDPSFRWAPGGGSVYVVFDSRWAKKSTFL
jgi:hypothetical protein